MAKSKLVALNPAGRPIDDHVKACVLKALDGNYPFVMIAKRPDGQWETSCFFRDATENEVIGALERWKNQSLNHVLDSD